MIAQAVLVCAAIAALWLPLLWHLTRTPYNSPEERSLMDLFRRQLNSKINRMNAEARAQLARKKGAYR